MDTFADFEGRLREITEELITAENDLLNEFLRLVAIGDHHWVAQKKAELTCGPAVTRARAEFEIYLARLKRN